ncbi:MAG: signal recognition particle-docking protein FtsY [Treponema sp.]|jgi:fused signal recognition particle receptor|nr:signal recognition particle-docking protein FtsY [Treponema sp.]
MTFRDKLKQFLGLASVLDDDFFDDLADILIEGDFGAALAFETIDELRRRCRKEKVVDIEAARQILAEMLEEMLRNAQINKEIDTETQNNLSVILLLGVNGVGKTTTAAKLANLLQKYGKTMLVAADTFRAAAIDQLKIHGERLGIRVVAHKQGGDPAAVVYDALEAAFAGHYTNIIADTAGRMHTKTALIEELKKIERVTRTAKRPPADGQVPPVLSRWLVLDATTGSNAFSQAETFHEAVKLDGVILTKTDSSAKGGIVFQLAAKLRLPTLYVCDGEKYENISLFNADEYIRGFLG